MYLIANATSKEIVISDLKLPLGPRKAIDLDRVRTREQIKQSRDLKACFKGGHIKLKRDDNPDHKTQVVSAEVKDEQIDKIRAAISEEIKSQLGSTQSSPPGDMMAMMEQIKAMIQQGGGVAGPVAGSSVSENDDLDDETLAEIHAKRMGKMTKGTMGKVHYEEKSVKDSIDDRTSELDGLLE